MANVLDWDILVSEFELQLCYYSWEKHEPRIPPAMNKIIPVNVFVKEGFWYVIKLRKQTENKHFHYSW